MLYLCALNCDFLNKPSLLYTHMKKYILTISLLCAAVGMMAQQAVKGAHPYKVSENEHIVTEFSHWSLTPHIGFNYFDGDFNSEAKHAVAIPNAGLDIEYAFTPVWSLGASYMFDQYTVTGRPGFDNADTLLNGFMHKAGIYVSMDFMGLFYPKAKRKICGIEAIFGAGYGWYKNNKMYNDDSRGHTASYVWDDGTVGPKAMDAYKGALYMQAGLNVEFNLNRTMALGVRATYNYFINDYPDNRGFSGMQALASKNNDGIVDVTLNMRFKLMGVSKTHMRNIASVNEIRERQREKERQEQDKKQMAQLQKMIQQAHDTVIIYRDTIIRETNNTFKEDVNVYYVYFDNNKDVIREDGLITIQQVADRLAEDSSLYAVVTGYCDNTGSKQLNYSLGDRRADNVIEELREEHGVANDHMYSTGLGKLIGRRSQAAYGPNRRAAIRLVDKETFDRMKGDLEYKRAHRDMEEEPAEAKPAPTVKTVPLNESAKPAKVNTYKQRSSEEVVTDKSTTLSKLARKYYNNTYCWVYIYIANKEKIANPNTITPGITLTIPELTKEEMSITKDQGLVIFSNARQGK